MRKETRISDKYSPYLARIFSSEVINDLAKTGHSISMEEILQSSGFCDNLNPKTTLREIFDQVHSYLSKTYRNEYIFKNAIANKILLGIHSLNTSCMLTEFRVADCKADVVVLNGTSNVYEIKTSLDSLSRLKRQLNAYQKVFDMVHVIVAPKQIEKVMKSVSDEVGLMVFTKGQTIRTVRAARSWKNNVVPEVIFDSLQRKEYCAIIKERLGEIPNVPNMMIYKECKKLFRSLSPAEAHDSMVKVLKKRGDSKSLKEFVIAAPKSLKAAAIHTRLNQSERRQFLNMLDSYFEFCVV